MTSVEGIEILEGLTLAVYHGHFTLVRYQSNTDCRAESFTEHLDGLLEEHGAMHGANCGRFQVQ